MMAMQAGATGRRPLRNLRNPAAEVRSVAEKIAGRFLSGGRRLSCAERQAISAAQCLRSAIARRAVPRHGRPPRLAVLSSDYRLASEHRFPIALHDVLDARAGAVDFGGVRSAPGRGAGLWAPAAGKRCLGRHGRPAGNDPRLPAHAGRHQRGDRCPPAQRGLPGHRLGGTVAGAWWWTQSGANPVLLVCGMEEGLHPSAEGWSAGSEIGTNPGLLSPWLSVIPPRIHGSPNG